MSFWKGASARDGGGGNRFSMRRMVAAASRFTKSVGLIVAMSTGVAVSTSESALAQVDREARINALLAADPTLRYVDETDKFYRARRTFVNWANAELQARTTERLGGIVGQLATISSLIENEVARELAVAAGGNLWLGGTDKDLEGTWKWYAKGVAGATFWQGKSNGAAVGGAYTRFNAGEPNDFANNEDGLEIMTNGLWNDLTSTNLRFFLVEWAAVDVVGPITPPPPLNTVPVPLPSNLDQFVKDRNRATLLGKALFWDMQVGGNGRVACATCHNNAGIDQRFINTLNPGAPGSTFGPQLAGQQQLSDQARASFRGANRRLVASDFPFHRVANPIGDQRGNTVLRDTAEVVGSQGILRRNLLRINPGSAVDSATIVADPVFNVAGVNVRQVTARSTPTTINAVFLDRQFWDGRANHFFNGVNPFGNTDPNARVQRRISTETVTTVTKVWVPTFLFLGYWKDVVTTTTRAVDRLEPTAILLNNASLASQAVGPPNNSVEMSFNGRSFKDLGRKMLALRPLATQRVHAQDSVFGPIVNTTGPGLQSHINYASLVRESFRDEWWNSAALDSAGYTQMESNFSMFWGIAIMLYESTLVSDRTPYDSFAAGNANAISESAKRGLKTFLNEGKCIDCHTGPEFAGATVQKVRSVTPSLIENMRMGDGNFAFYDTGFYNIGVRPTLADLGVGAVGPFGPLSYSAQRQAGRDVGQNIAIPAGARLAVRGGFKAPSLRNIELTGPYFHNGGTRTLREAVEFYVRGADFFDENIADLDADVDGIPSLQNNPAAITDLVEFLKTLTDDRVRTQKAPFDHPELPVGNGHQPTAANGIYPDNGFLIPAVGASGGPTVVPFEQIVR